MKIIIFNRETILQTTFKVFLLIKDMNNFILCFHSLKLFAISEVQEMHTYFENIMVSYIVL